MAAGYAARGLGLSSLHPPRGAIAYAASGLIAFHVPGLPEATQVQPGAAPAPGALLSTVVPSAQLPVVGAAASRSTSPAGSRTLK